MFRPVKGHHQAKILAIKRKKDAESLFHKLKSRLHKSSLHFAVQYAIKIQMAFKQKVLC
jgi:HPt (histidine-containing phosphotransfer) domain-containing protein